MRIRNNRVRFSLIDIIGDDVMAPVQQPEEVQSGKNVLLTIIAFIVGTVLLLLAAKALLG